MSVRSKLIPPSHANTNEFVEKIGVADTEYELLDACNELSKSCNLPYFSILRLPEYEDHKLTELNFVSNWPAYLVAEYDKNNLLEHSPIIAHFKASTEPFIFDTSVVNKNRRDGKEPDVVNIFHQHGIFNGVYFGTHHANGLRGAVSFCGNSTEPSETLVLELAYLANLIFTKWFVLKNENGIPAFELTQREVDCLEWTSKGKTSAEIATILGLTEHTVSHYLAMASKKLDTSNRVHAVSKALRLKIIS